MNKGRGRKQTQRLLVKKVNTARKVYENMFIKQLCWRTRREGKRAPRSPPPCCSPVLFHNANEANSQRRGSLVDVTRETRNSCKGKRIVSSEMANRPCCIDTTNTHVYCHGVPRVLVTYIPSTQVQCSNNRQIKTNLNGNNPSKVTIYTAISVEFTLLLRYD